MGLAMILAVIFALAFTATLLAAIVNALLLLATVAGAGGIGSIAATSAVVVVGWVVIRFVLFPPLLRLRGRPPRRCRSCALTFPG